MVFFVYQFALGDFAQEVFDGVVEFWFICAFEIFNHLAVEKGDEIGDSCDVVGAWAISAFRGIACSEDQVWVVVVGGSFFENWLYTHTRWT